MTTTTFTAKEAKNNFGRLLDEARRIPVTIEKNGRPVAVVMSLEEYNEFEIYRDALWGRRAEQARKKGFIGVAKTRRFLDEAINARD